MIVKQYECINCHKAFKPGPEGCPRCKATSAIVCFRTCPKCHSIEIHKTDRFSAKDNFRSRLLRCESCDNFFSENEAEEISSKTLFLIE